MTLRQRIDYRVSVRPVFLGLDPLAHTARIPGAIVAVESYAGSAPTFTWLARSGHLFAYLPNTAFGEENDLTNLVDFHCPDSAIDVVTLGIAGPGWGKVGEREVAWKTYLLTVDWPRSNQLAHLVVTPEGELVWLRNSRFQIGGASFEAPPWKKARREWEVL